MNDNELLYLTCSACITAAEDNGAPRFTMTAYTGKTIDVGFGKPVVIDLAGIDLSRQKIPIFYAHETDKGVGHTETLAVIDGALHAEGRVSRNTPYAADIIASGSGCSCYLVNSRLWHWIGSGYFNNFFWLCLIHYVHHF